ncbi:hypothetical protein A7X68_16810 [Stenotrophomonas maltophilia]|nr:hypothetical protein A7X68_16810 [Stenotrophomonas maltophilia]
MALPLGRALRSVFRRVVQGGGVRLALERRLGKGRMDHWRSVKARKRMRLALHHLEAQLLIAA